MPGAASYTASITASGSAVPVGLFGDVRKTRSGPSSRTVATAVAGGRYPAGARVLRGLLVHRVRRLEAERGAAGPAEGEQQLLHDLVGAVGGPDLVPPEPVPEVGGQVVAQADDVAVRVPVQGARYPGHRVGDRPDEGGRRRVGVLVDVQPHRDVK